MAQSPPPPVSAPINTPPPPLALPPRGGGRARAPVEVGEALVRAQQTLFKVRAKRPRPQLDDKVLTAWNGLMIAAFARGARVLGGGAALDRFLEGEDPGARHLRSAEQSASFIRTVMWDGEARRLLRRFRAGDAAIDGYAEDYAYLIFGILELFQATGDPAWLSWARQLQDRQDELFWDAEHGGWFSTTGADPSVLLRMKEDYDGAEPSPTSVSALNLLTLAHLTGEPGYIARAGQAIAAFGGRLIEQGRAVPMMAAALSTSLAGGEQLLIVGQPDAADTKALWRAAHHRYRPFAVCVPVSPDRQQALAEHMPWVAAMTMVGGKATAYRCRNFACEAPATDPEALR